MCFAPKSACGFSTNTAGVTFHKFSMLQFAKIMPLAGATSQSVKWKMRAWCQRSLERVFAPVAPTGAEVQELNTHARPARKLRAASRRRHACMRAWAFKLGGTTMGRPFAPADRMPINLLWAASTPTRAIIVRSMTYPGSGIANQLCATLLGLRNAHSGGNSQEPRFKCEKIKKAV